jgi:hypothetical protein
MERIATLHAALLFTILLVFGALALWGLVGGAMGRGPGRLYRSGLLIGQLLLAAEALLGVALLLGGLRPAQPELHVLYAAVALATLPGARRYVRDRAPRQQLLTYALACLFLCAVALRGVETGRGAAAERPAQGVQHPPKGGETPA